MNSTIMCQRTIRVRLVWVAVGLLLGSTTACSKDDSAASANAAKAATPSPSPFSVRSSRLVEGPAIRVTPNLEIEQSPATEPDETPAYDRVFITTEADPDSGGAPLMVNFVAQFEGGPPGLEYRWDFGDDTPLVRQLRVQHTYQQAGDYTATFSVTGPDVEESDEVRISVDEEGFDFDIETDPDVGSAPLKVQFNGRLDEDLPGPFYFQWDFGDGGRDVSNPTTHSYREAGEYTATATVTNAQGQHTTREVQITVDAPENAAQ